MVYDYSNFCLSVPWASKVGSLCANTNGQIIETWFKTVLCVITMQGEQQLIIRVSHSSQGQFVGVNMHTIALNSEKCSGRCVCPLETVRGHAGP